MEADALMTAYRQVLAEYEQQASVGPREAQRLKELAATSHRMLAESAVGEGETVSIHLGREDQTGAVAMMKGEVLQLTVLPNANHGADTTRVELEITLQADGPRRSWNPEGLIDRFTAGGPSLEQDGATWFLLDVTDGPLLLHEKKQSINGQPSLNGWAIGDTPSSIVNASAEVVDVWTKLPPRAFFVHPGPQRNVAVAWVCPEDGAYQVRGAVTDAHPAGLDGVSFRLEHVASADFGLGLVALGSQQAMPLPQRPAPPPIPVAYAVVDGEAKHARIQERGDPEKLGDEAPRRWLSVFGGAEVPPESGSGRWQLADAVAGHPLMARVMVNRIWEWHFGRGLVRTSNDFGSRGEPPTHPELLDFLAAKFVQGGCSVKAMHRLIIQTAAYQRASAAPSTGDPENGWLAHFSRRRLRAEEIRDSLLAASGGLDLSPGEGHPFPPEATWSFTQHAPFNAVYETNRRSAYLMVQRQRRHPFLALFDGADPNASTPARQTTTVPTQALYFINDPFFHEQGMHTGSFAFSRPSIGSWITYGLGTLNRNLPGFVVIAPKQPYAGTQVYANDFLPGAYQGTLVVPGPKPVANIRPRVPPDRQRLELAALREMNEEHLATRGRDPQLSARLETFETAFGMQMAVPDAVNFAEENDATTSYALQRGQTTGFGWQCLAARRLIERGVRFVELIDTGSSDNWDAHGDMMTHAPLAKNVDQPIAALIGDLKARGLFDETLIVWTTEFGRTPFNNTADAKGREHHPWAFSSWLAGAGVKCGIVHGASDEIGLRAVEKPVHVHDLHATMLHLMGFDHERLTHRHAGLDFRLTGVDGAKVVTELLA